ncbi:MAG: sensor histidine kinase [Bacteroidales bacterium]
MKIKQIRLLAPIIFWIFQFVIHVIRNLYKILDGSFASIFKPIAVTYPLDIITFAIFYFFFAPRLYKKRRLSFYILLIIFYVHAYSFAWSYVYYKLGVSDINELKLYYFSSIGHSLLFAFYGIIFRFAIDWFENREIRKELEQQNTKIELALLRSQINPHFLFNTLNNINSFATKNSEKTSYAIVKLSEIMRYMLYEAKEDKVFIEKEITHIENYLALQKLRYKTQDFVTFNCNCDTANILIPPMLFIPFIENAFKHGKKGSGNKIEINLRIYNKVIHFKCTNRIKELNDTEKNDVGGFGIENIKRRLDLLYPEKHQLTIDTFNNTYSINLIINTNEN